MSQRHSCEGQALEFDQGFGLQSLYFERCRELIFSLQLSLRDNLDCKRGVRILPSVGSNSALVCVSSALAFELGWSLPLDPTLEARRRNSSIFGLMRNLSNSAIQREHFLVSFQNQVGNFSYYLKFFHKYSFFPHRTQMLLTPFQSPSVPQFTFPKTLLTSA